MILDPKILIDTLAKHQLDIEQYLLCYLLCTDITTLTDVGNKYAKTALIYQYHAKVGQFSLKKIGDLVDKGYLIDHNKPDASGRMESYPDHYEVTEKFKAIAFGDPDEMGEQIWQIYPDIITVDGKRLPAKTASCGKDELLELYIKAIKKSKPLHASIITLLKTLKENDQIKMGIEKWIKNHYWEVEFKQLDSLVAKTTAHANRRLT